MTQFFSKNFAMVGAAFTMGMLAVQPAHAAPAGGAAGGGGVKAITGDNLVTSEAKDGFGALFERITISFGGVTGLISMAAYVMGIIMLIGGILKIKDHVEDPSRTDLKTGAIRVIIGGGLLALPTLLRLATSTFGDQEQDVAVNTLKRGTFGFAK